MRALAVMLVILLAGLTARADESVETQPLVLHGVRGIWFPRDAADRLQRDALEVASCRVQIPTLESKVQLEHERAGLLEQNLHWTEEIATIWKESFQAYVRSVRPPVTHWYQSPVFWLAMGSLATGALAIGLAFGLQGSR